MKKALLLLVVLLVASGSALAHGRGRVTFGLHFGFPIYPHPYYYYPPPPVYYYPYPAVAAPPPSPPVYVEREEDWWYYCEQTRAYYPYVKECAGGWKRVPPAPPPAQ